MISKEHRLITLMLHYRYEKADSMQTSSPSKLYLKALEVGFVLNNLHEWLSGDMYRAGLRIQKSGTKVARHGGARFQ